MKEIDSNIQKEPVKRVSIKRLSFVVVILLGIGYYGITFSWGKWQESESVGGYEPWFAAYVDVTSTPAYKFEKQGTGGGAGLNAILSFIVSSHEKPCTPTWGGYYTIDEAALSLDLDRRIARLQQQSGRIAISFGGALNSELAIHCTDQDVLLHAYHSVIERYNVNTIDLDLENEGLTNIEAVKRRADVIAQLQKNYRDNGKNLAVWLTLPVTPQGLSKEGTDAISYMLSGKVDLAGVNLMTMDYGESKEEKNTMFEASKKALIESHRQIGVLYKRANINLNSISLWKKIGATPMIGQNDILGEIFTVEDAKALNIFAQDQGVGRISMWSANRDVPCGENYVDLKVVSDGCSGVASPQYIFARTLSLGFEGNLFQSAKLVTIEDPKVNYHIEDDPEKSPYQIWQETGAYHKGTKVVWHGSVYEAKWWTQGDLPDNPVLQLWETPWGLVGPVLEGEKPVQPLTLPDSVYPNWSGVVVYDEGDRVLFRGIPFQAKWWNQGQSPAASAANYDNSPWQPLTKEQVEEILKVLKK